MQDGGISFLLQNYSTSLSVFNNPDLYPDRMRIQSLRMLLELSKFKEIRNFGGGYKLPERNQIYTAVNKIHEKMLSKYQKTPNDIVDIHEIEDIFFTFFPNRVGAHQDQRQEIVRDVKLPTNIFQDKQNVHDAEINQKNIKIAIALINKFPAADEKNNLDSFQDFIENYNKNTAIFGNGARKFRLIDVLMSLVSFAECNEFKEEVLKILYEQLVEGERYCSTGKLGRLVSVMQGFTDDKSLMLILGDDKFMKSHILNFINNEIQTCDNEDVIDGLLNKNDVFKKFVNESAKRWKKKYSARFKISFDKMAEILNRNYLV